MTPNSSSDFKEYIQGYYAFTPPRGGAYRLRMNTVMDASISLSTFIENVTHDWGQKDTRSISDLKAQRIWDPVKIGYLMRAPRFLTHSYELITALETEANKHVTGSKVYFSMSWGTIPSPVGGYDKDTAVQAVMLETNREHLDAAVHLLRKWYPLNPKQAADPPYPGNFRFVLNRDNSRIKGNPIALSNLSILMERQGIFNDDTAGEQTFCIKDLDAPFKEGATISMREKLLRTKIKTLDEDLKGSPLFLSISTSINNRTGHKSVWFTFHKRAAKEAISIVRNLPIFLESEWQINPETLCYAQFLNPSDKWDPTLRVANNEDTDEIRMAVEIYSADLQKPEAEEKAAEHSDDDVQSMTSKAQREMTRMIRNDDETVLSLTKAKYVKTRPSSIMIRDDGSRSGISGVSGTSSRSSVVRAQMQKQFDKEMAAQKRIVAQLKADKALQARQQETLAAQIAQLQEIIANLHHQQPPRPPSPKTPSVPLPPVTQEMKDLDQNPSFDVNTADENFQCLVAEYEQRLIDRLDHIPTEPEMVLLSREAHKLAAIVHDQGGKLSSYSEDSDEPIHTPPRMRKDKNHFEESDTDMEADTHNQLKRLATTQPEDADTEKFNASPPTSPKKKAHVSGDDPGFVI